MSVVKFTIVMSVQYLFVCYESSIFQQRRSFMNNTFKAIINCNFRDFNPKSKSLFYYIVSLRDNAVFYLTIRNICKVRIYLFCT